MHTKRPWKINHTGDDAVVIIDADCLRITVDHRQDFGNALSDAQLIAAAPELLAMVKDLASVCLLLRSNPAKAYGVMDLLVEAEKLIAKAQGH